MIERCYSCMGKKTIIGLGALIKDCPVCDGVGHITIKEDSDCIDLPNEPINLFNNKGQHILSIESKDVINHDELCKKTKQQRGRPKKVNNERRES